MVYRNGLGDEEKKTYGFRDNDYPLSRPVRLDADGRHAHFW